MKNIAYVENLDKLTISDLKKIHKSLQLYVDKKKPIELENKKLMDEKRKLRNDIEELKKQDDIKSDEFRERNKDLISTKNRLWEHIKENHSIGFSRLFKNVYRLTFSEDGNDYVGSIEVSFDTFYRNPLVQSFLRSRKDLHDRNQDFDRIWRQHFRKELSELNKKFYSIKTISEKYIDPTLTISGSRLKLSLTKWTLDEVSKALNEKIVEEKKASDVREQELNTLKSRAYTNESEVRLQANKYRNLPEQLKKLDKCPYCSGPLSEDNAHLDHIYPVSKGGKSTAVNLVFICSKCNLSKSSTTLNKFIKKNNLDNASVHQNLELLNKDY